MVKPEAPARLPRLLQGIAGLALALMLAACQPADNGDARMPPNKGVASSLHLNALMDAVFDSEWMASSPVWSPSHTDGCSSETGSASQPRPR